MKIIIDTKTGEVKSQGKLFQELDEVKRNAVESFVRDFLRKNTQLTDYEEDSEDNIFVCAVGICGAEPFVGGAV